MQMDTMRQTVGKLEQLRDERSAEAERMLATQKVKLVAYLRSQGVSLRAVTALASMVLQEKLSKDAIDEICRTAEYLQDVQRAMKLGHDEMKVLLRGAAALSGQLAGQGVTPEVMAELAKRVLAAPAAPAAMVPGEMATRAPGFRAYLRPAEVVRVVLAPGPGVPWTQPPAVQLAELRSKQRSDVLVVTRAVLVWLLKCHTLQSYPEISMITRGRRESHSTAITQLQWLTTWWDMPPAAPWRSHYRTIGGMANELSKLCRVRKAMKPTDDMEAMRGIVLGYMGEGVEGDGEEA